MQDHALFYTCVTPCHLIKWSGTSYYQTNIVKQNCTVFELLMFLVSLQRTTLLSRDKGCIFSHGKRTEGDYLMTINNITVIVMK